MIARVAERIAASDFYQVQIAHPHRHRKQQTDEHKGEEERANWFYDRERIPSEVMHAQ